MKTRVGIEAQRIYRANTHGMDVYAIECIKALSSFNHAFEIYVFVRSDVKSDVLKDIPNINIIVRKGWGGYLGWEQFILPLLAYKYRVHILHCTSSTGPVLFFGKIVQTLHDIIFTEKPFLSKGSLYQQLGNIYRKIVVPILSFKARKIITVSHYEKDTILSKFPYLANKLIVVDNGCTRFETIVTPSTFSAEVLENEYVFFLGNTDMKKNLRNVLIAFNEVRQQNVPLKLIIIDVQESFIKEQLLLLNIENLATDIITLPYISNSEIGLLYKHAKLFIYPSLRESFGLPILEAMACNTPVITSNISSMPEVAGNAALLINPYDPLDLAHTIMKLYYDADLAKKLVNLGQNRVQLYTWKSTAQKNLSIYSSLVA